MKRLLVVFLLVGTCAVTTFAQDYFPRQDALPTEWVVPALHSSKDQKQVIEAVLRHELVHKKGIVFLRVLTGNPSQELVQALSDLPVRILPASRAKEGTRGFDVRIVSSYKDEVSGKVGPLLDIHRLEWKEEGYVRMIGGWDGMPLGAFIVTLEKNQWRVR